MPTEGKQSPVQYHQRCCIKKNFLKNFAITKTLVLEPFFIKTAPRRPAIKKETLAQVFSSEYFKMFKNIYLEEHLQIATSLATTSLFFPCSFSANLFLH